MVLRGLLANWRGGLGSVAQSTGTLMPVVVGYPITDNDQKDVRSDEDKSSSEILRDSRVFAWFQSSKCHVPGP